MDQGDRELSKMKEDNRGLKVIGSLKSDEIMDVSDDHEVFQNKSSHTRTTGTQATSCEGPEGSELSKKCDLNPPSYDVVMTGSVGSPVSDPDEFMDISEKSSQRVDVGGGGELLKHDSQIKINEPPICDSSQDSQSPESTKASLYYRCPLPQINCPEKIIICMDLSSEMNQSPFKLGNGSKFPPISMVKRVTEIFIHNKSKINKKHEYALVALHEKATWVKGFTSDPNDVCYALDNFTNTKVCSSCELSSLFKLISDKIEFPERPDPLNPLPFIVRVILIYGRSNCIPEFDDDVVSLKALKKTGCFFFDVLYIHEPASADNNCQEVFESFCDMDENMTSYLFEVTRNTTKLHNCMAKLLSHPLQRPVQRDAAYKL